MSDVTINYKGNAIATMDASGTKTLLTEGKYCEDDIEVVYVSPGGGGTDYLGELLNRTLVNYTNSDLTQFSSDRTFSGLTTLTSFSFPNVTQCYDNAASYFFARCTGLTVIPANALPKFEKFNRSQSVFEYCTNLTVVVLPSYYSTAQNLQFRDCTKLKTVDLGNATIPDPNSNLFNQSFFSGCTLFDTLILRHSYVPKLGNINNFNGTPFASGGTGGTIYIPKSLYDHLGDNSSSDYKAASNWSTINGYGTITWAKIEGSIYETQYADGTAIPT